MSMSNVKWTHMCIIKTCMAMHVHVMYSYNVHDVCGTTWPGYAHCTHTCLSVDYNVTSYHDHR